MSELWTRTDNGTNILTGTGRIVQGDCLKPQDKDAEGRPLVYKTGVNAGQPKVQYFMGLAIPKTDPSWPLIQTAILAEAKAGFPHLFDAAGTCKAPSFAFKFTDGDSTTPNTKGVVPSSREGFPGHFVLQMSNGFAPKCFKRGPMGLEPVTDPETIKRGYYVKVYATVKANGSTQNPGVYINTSMILMEKIGDEIFSGPNAEDVFGGGSAPVTPPAGSPAPPAVPSFPPAPDFTQGPAVTPPPPPAPAAEKSYNVNGSMCTHSQLIAAGWTEPQIAAIPQ